MSEHIIAVRCEINGLFIKKCGTYAKGATWSIDTVPEYVINKAIAENNTATIGGKKQNMFSFITPTGGIVNLSEAYIPRFNIGKPPPELEIYEVSKKSREVTKESSVDVPVTKVAKTEDKPKFEDKSEYKDKSEDKLVEKRSIVSSLKDRIKK